MLEQAPLTFRPYFRSLIWGGNKIYAYKGLPVSHDSIGESWEICGLDGHDSVVDRGTYIGETLNGLIARFGDELLGRKVTAHFGVRFPLLIKFIDAASDLSVQVHPNDAIARARHNCNGKEEMWYIIKADEGAKIYSGLAEEMTPERYVDRVADGTFSDALAAYDSRPGDVFYLPAGRVHAIGAGNLLAEIQEASDVTYRIYDYGRLDADGRPRELHTELAKDAIDYTLRNDYRSPRAADAEPDCEIASGHYFTTRRINLDAAGRELTFDPGSFTVVMCVSGKAVISYPDGEIELTEGHTALLPAVLSRVTASGPATILAAQAL